MNRFPVYIERILAHEGGYSDDHRDPGNWTGGRVNVGTLKGTKFGIAANTYPRLDIRNLTREKAIAIYRRDFWDAVEADQLPAALAYQMLDAAVNHGIDNAKRMLQAAAGAAPDGRIGPATRAAIKAADPADLLLQFFATRIEFYAGLSKFNTYGRGWMRRMVGNLRYATQDN